MVAAITLTPDHGPVGTVVTVDGTGFNNDEDVVINFAGAPVVTTPNPAHTDMSGVFSATFVVPDHVKGVASVDATDETLSTDDADFTVEPKITLTPTTGAVGSSVTIDGTGFTATDNISSTFDGIALVTDPVGPVVDADGNFTADFTVPSKPAGAYAVVCTDENAGTDDATYTVKTAPAAPVLDSAEATSDTEIDLSWTVGATGGSAITGYKIERNLNSGGWATLVADTGNGTTTYTDSTLDPQDQADYRISAINAIGTSTVSNVMGDQTWDVPDAPVLTLGDHTISTIDVSWTTPDDHDAAITKYTVSWSDDGFSTQTDDDVIGANTYQITGLDFGTIYDVKVTATNSIGESVDSNIVTETTNAPDIPWDNIGSAALHAAQSYLYKEAVVVPVNSDTFEPRFTFDIRTRKALLLQIVNTHASKNLIYNIWGCIHESDDIIPPTNATDLALFWTKILAADVEVAAGASKTSSVNAIDTPWSYILFSVKRKDAGQDSEATVYAKEITTNS